MIFALAEIASTKKRIIAILLHQTAFNWTGFYWVPHTLQEFGGLPPGVSHTVALFLAPVLNPQWWGWLLWLKWAKRVPGFSHWTPSMRALFGAILLCCFEIIIPQQFPVYAGHVWMQYDRWLNLAPYGGVSLYSFFTWWMVLSLVPLLKRQAPSRFGVTATLMFLAVHFFLPHWELHQDTMDLNVRVVQANIGNFLKIESEAGVPGAIEDVVSRYRALSLKENPQSLDLIIWPETAYPFSMSSDEFRNKQDAPASLFREIIAQTNAEMLFGGYDREAEAQWMDRYMTEYNAAFHIGTQGEFRQVYRKHILIPFGETLPFGPLNKPLSKILTTVSFFARGYEFPVFTTKKGVRFVTPICYEILQPQFIADLLNQAPQPAHFIVNLTNDSWYGKTAEPFQHLFLAKWRAIEFRRPIVRSTNTGITTVIYPNGLEGRRLYTGEKDVLDVRLQLPVEAPQTVYQLWGRLPLVALWFLLGLSLSIYWYLKNRPAADHVNATLP
jgi:apolipoprotein N-acyltransferase